MSDIAIQIENLSKQYRLGLVGTGTLSHDLNRWWHMIRGKEDPYLKIGEKNTRDQSGASDYVWALKNIDFTVKKGEVLGIIGGNGAGKSTLLKILSQVTGPSTGSFKAQGRMASLLEVGTGFHAELTGRENIYLNGTILGMTKAEITAKFDEIVAFSGVERYVNTPVKRYSSGMKVRLAFAVAAHLEPEILIVDEVLAVGDVAFQGKAIGKIQQVSHDHGRTVLFVSHDMESVSRLCTRTIILRDGQIAFDGPTDEAIAEYSRQMFERTASASIADRTDRAGRGQVRFQNLWLENMEGHNIPVATVGHPLRICVEVATADQGEAAVSAAVGIKRENGEEITMMSIWSKGQRITIDDRAVIVFEIPKISMIEGEYILDLFMENGNMGNDIQDHLHNAFSLKVVGKDFYKSGQVVKSFKYKQYIDFDFFVRSAKKTD
ncbi:ABC transporter ATP-binding protein [Flavimarina sp. Hel_I_48]|uniref:ABC transporter ATP-binding protein n=1 Tax=Flavimarina sp. Hel_I_48 TaxID=1392488 RepID=UPI0004DF498D|nr:ABC transporter ATP-binding protein [Flavimarina sp. Hel_I_48]